MTHKHHLPLYSGAFRTASNASLNFLHNAGSDFLLRRDFANRGSFAIVYIIVRQPVCRHAYKKSVSNEIIQTTVLSSSLFPHTIQHSEYKDNTNRNNKHIACCDVYIMQSPNSIMENLTAKTLVADLELLLKNAVNRLLAKLLTKKADSPGGKSAKRM